MNNFDDIRASALAKYFYKLAEQSQDVFWIRSKDYREQIYISPKFEESWGISCQALYEQPGLWTTALYPEDRARLENEGINHAELARIGETIEKNYRIVRPDKTIRWIKDVSFGLFDEKNECFGFAGICKDISKDVIHSQELEEAKLNAEIANQAKADFLAKMSHEFRTPLNAIIGMTQILQKKGLLPEYEEYIQLISQAGNSLLSLVNDILDFAKVEIGELSFASEPMDLHLLISQVVHSFKYQAEEKNIALTLHYDTNTPKFVMGDAKRIRQIMVNLINNALKFTDNGSIDVKVDYHHDDQCFYIAVKDSGIGIDKSKHAYIFEKFSQIAPMNHRKQQGTGLGLAITKQLVERIGGTIVVESEPGVGSIFKFDLPLMLQDSANVHAVNSPESISLKDKTFDKLSLKVLLVEDNLINQSIARLMLEGLGCELSIANDGNEAIELIERQPQFYDVILMDIGLPELDGFEVTAKIRERQLHANLPIIAMTAHALECDQQKCIEAGMDNILIKPISYDELYEMLRPYKLSENRHE